MSINKKVLLESDFQEVKEVSKGYDSQRAVLSKVYIEYEPDTLTGEEGTVGVIAKGVIHIPFSAPGYNMDRGEFEEQTHYKLETISSGGLWGVDEGIRDYEDDEYFEGVEREELHELLGYLRVLNVVTDLFE